MLQVMGHFCLLPVAQYCRVTNVRRATCSPRESPSLRKVTRLRDPEMTHAFQSDGPLPKCG